MMKKIYKDIINIYIFMYMCILHMYMLYKDIYVCVCVCFIKQISYVNQTINKCVFLIFNFFNKF